MPELRVDLPDELYDAVERAAARQRCTPEALVVDAVRTQLRRPDIDARQRALAALGRLVTSGGDPAVLVRAARSR